MTGRDEQEFRRACIEALTRSESLDFMIVTLKDIATQLGSPSQNVINGAVNNREELPEFHDMIRSFASY